MISRFVVRRSDCLAYVSRGNGLQADGPMHSPANYIRYVKQLGANQVVAEESNFCSSYLE